MNTFTVTATQLKQDTATILNQVQYSGKTALILKHAKVVARLEPLKTQDLSLDHTRKMIEDYAGTIPDFPKIYNDRHDRKKDLSI